MASLQEYFNSKARYQGTIESEQFTDGIAIWNGERKTSI